MSVTRGNPDALFDSVQHGFSQAVAASGSRIIAVSGQVAWTADKELVGSGDLFAETTKALENVQVALRSLDAELTDVIALRLYIVDYGNEDAPKITRALKTFFPEGAPAATWVGVSCLADSSFRIEVEATAVS